MHQANNHQQIIERGLLKYQQYHLRRQETKRDSETEPCGTLAVMFQRKTTKYM